MVLVSLPLAGARLAWRLATFPARASVRVTLLVAEQVVEALQKPPSAGAADPGPGADAGAPPVGSEPPAGSRESPAPIRPAIARRPRTRRAASTPGLGPSAQSPAPPAAIADRAAATRAPAAKRPARTPASRARDATPPAEPTAAPAPPAPPQEPAHVDTEAVLVAESADPGAADGAGASISVEPPWPRYSRMSAPAVIDRLAAEPETVLAVVLLYERGHRKRRSVIEAAERELTRRGEPAGRR